MAEPGINWHIADALTLRQVRVRRAESQERRAVLTHLAILQADLLAALKLADPMELPFLQRRLAAVQELLDEEWEPLITATYAALARETRTFLTTLADQEVQAVQRIVEDVTDTPVIPETPADRTVRRRVTGMLIPSPQRPTDLSTTGDDWWARQGEGLLTRLSDQMRVSVSLEETLTQAQQRIQGSSEQGFQDGIMQKARDDASRLLTTQTSNAVAEAHVATVDANKDTAILIHVGALERNTCVVCFSRHGKKFDAVTHEPIGHTLPYLTGVPYHPNCVCDLIPGTLHGGPIPNANLDAWLRRQRPAVQEDILGATRARLWREGRLSAKDLLSAATGRPLTLEELGVT